MLHPQRKTMDLVPLVCLCLLTWSAGTAADHKPEVVYVEPGSDVILPCSLSTQEGLVHFEWKKDQKQVFFYDGGSHSNNNPTGQDEQFKGRVFYFHDKLKNGSASIMIRNTQLNDSGNYTCDFPRLQPPQTFHIKLVVVEPVVVKVEPGRDVILPCSPRTKSISYELFEWKKDQKQVFLYDGGSHSNINPTGQNEQFKGRVFHFSDQLKNGNASIEIRNTQLADSGIYTCVFPRLQPPQTFHIKLVFGGDLRNRYPGVKGAAPRPHAKIGKSMEDGVQLICEVKGASTEPKVEWWDSDGKVISHGKPQVSQIGNLYNVTLLTTVNKTNRFRCVSTQKELSHRTEDDVYVQFSEAGLLTPLDVLLLCPFICVFLLV